MKNLFQEKNINIHSNIILKPSDNLNDLSVVLQQIGLSQDVNIKKTVGLCFSCAFNCTVNDYAIRCYSCERASLSYWVFLKNNIHTSNSEVLHYSSCLKKE